GGGAREAVAAPGIPATWVTEVTATSANLRAEIDPGGHSTTYRFEYLTLAAYRANLEAVPPREGFFGAAKAPPGGAASAGSGSTPVTVVQHVAGLSPATAYRFQARATSSEGTTTGPERVLGTEEATNAFHLLDQRGWEMVSPIEKNGGAIQGFGENFGGDVLQAAADGDSLTYSSATSFGDAPEGAPPASQYIATRGSGGWSSQNVTEPTPSGGYGDHPEGVPYQLFSTDLARGLLLDPRRCVEGKPCPRSYSLRESASGALTTTSAEPGLRFAGSDPDLRHVVLKMAGGLYEWSEGQLVQISVAPGAELAAQAGAVSANGSRVYFTSEGKLYLRDGATTKPVDESLGGGGTFQTASADGRFAFFTKAGHLYRYDAVAATSADLTPSGGVAGVLGASAAGDFAYFQDGSGLQRWHAPNSLTQVAAAAAAAAPSDYPPATGTARVSPDGSHLLFVSTAELSAYESNGASEVFLYGPSPGGGQALLSCVSCNPTGERPGGPSSIPGAVANGEGPNATRMYKPRALSADGSRAFFDSKDSLAIQDTNSRADVYEWEAPGAGTCTNELGCVGLVSSGRSGTASTFVDASADGSDAFFLTDSSLYPLDPGSFDVYDARVGGGFAPPPNTIPCNGDACQSLPSAPEDPTPGTLVPNSGNPALRIVKQRAKKHHHKKRHHRRRRARHGGGR
ncbi:MAG TPA: hypothetical protein VFJ64_10320, partial [Solirubrobacterales bacterium]|nr:hypothetical protein [Solirubrobacterales bacterium]